MKVFISWSGDTSKEVGGAIHEWLPQVIQNVEPYMSSEDIDKGARWSIDIAQELEASTFGIICLTKDNLDAPWLMFEAGALSRTLDKARVVPLLFDMKNAEIKGPLVQFQTTLIDQTEVLRLVRSINSAAGDEGLTEALLDRAFKKWWPDLELSLNNIREKHKNLQIKPESKSNQKDSMQSIVEEILELSRSQAKLLRDPFQLLPPPYIMELLSMDAERKDMITPSHPAFRDAIKNSREMTEYLNSGEPINEDCRPKLVKWATDIRDALSYIRTRAYKRPQIFSKSFKEP